MSDYFEKKIFLFADQDVGYMSLEFIISEHKNSLLGVITVGLNEISNLAEKHGIVHFDFNDYRNGWSTDSLKKVDYIILAWWPKIIKKEIINAPKIGVINFHPSFLPFNRGKNYNFWSIVEECKFGVTLHFVDEGIDTGDIIFQREINISWEDSGESLYLKAKSEMLKLFMDSYSNILRQDFTRIKQDLSKGSFHYAKELDNVSELELDKDYKAKDLLNLLRARTFTGKPSCFFIDNGVKYDVRISITKQNNY